MKSTQLILMAGLVISIAACKSSKNSTSTTATPTPESTNTTTTKSPELNSPYFKTKTANGIYPPGNDELSAIQVKYPDVTLDKLNKGYSLYAESACLQCHMAKNVYRIEEEQWKDICDNMANKAKITAEQKDAVYKYVLAIKASQAKGSR